MELPYTVLMERITRSICIGDTPVGRSVTEACGQMSSFAATDRTVEFDTDADVETSLRFGPILVVLSTMFAEARVTCQGIS